MPSVAGAAGGSWGSDTLSAESWVSISTSCAAAMIWLVRSMAVRAPSRMKANSRVSCPINSGIAAVAASTCSGSPEASAARVGSISRCTRCMSMSSFSTL
jgi:hypothetical protein